MVYQKLKSRIVEHFGTQADFAPVVGRDDAFISRVVRGRRQLPASEQGKWAEALKCDVTELLL